MSDLLDFGAEFSPDRVFRYRLWRRWDHGPMLLVIGLNPSTADETTDDPTVRRCLDYARRWGFAGLRMMNLFAFRATDPKAMLAAADPIGRENRSKIRTEARITVLEGGAVLAAWGNHGAHKEQSAWARWGLDVEVGGVACLGLTKREEPKHPLYLARETKPVPFLGDGGRLVTAPLARADR